jgi:hypothetical protein
MPRKKKQIINTEPEHSFPVPESEFTPSQEEIDYAKSEGFDIRSLYHPNSNYSVEKKIETVATYLVTASSRKTAKIVGRPDSTIRWWMSTAFWWAEAMDHARVRMEKKLEARLYQGLNKGMEIINRGMDEGKDVISEVVEITEVVSPGKYEEIAGKSVQVAPPELKKTKINKYTKQEIPVKEAAIAFSIMWDKLQLAQGKPTSRTESVATPEKLVKELRKELENLSEATLKEKKANTVSTQ